MSFKKLNLYSFPELIMLHSEEVVQLFVSGHENKAADECGFFWVVPQSFPNLQRSFPTSSGIGRVC